MTNGIVPKVIFEKLGKLEYDMQQRIHRSQSCAFCLLTLPSWLDKKNKTVV